MREIGNSMGRKSTPYKRLLKIIELAFTKQPFTSKDLEAIEVDGEYPYIESADASQLLRDDRQLLSENFGLEVVNQKGIRSSYELEHVDESLRPIYLPDIFVDLAALVTVPPVSEHIEPTFQREVERVVRCRLGRRHSLLDERKQFAMELVTFRDQDNVAPQVISQFEHWIRERQVIRFQYQSSGGNIAIFEMEPYRIKPQEGHLYLIGYCRKIYEGDQVHRVNDHRKLRLGSIYIDTIEITGEFYKIEHRPRSYRVHYILSKKLARRPSVTFNTLHERRLSDGRLEIVASTDSPFDAMRKLLSYGAHCQVIGGTEVLELYQAELQVMCQQFTTS